MPLDREPYLDVRHVIAWSGERVTSLVFHRGKEALATVDVGEPPHVAISGPDREDGRLAVHVRATHPREQPTVVVLFTGDDGVTWQPVAFDPVDGRVSVQVDRLPGGERCRFRAIATAELQSAVADTGPFELSRQPRRMHVVIPRQDCAVAPGPVPLRVLIDTRGLDSMSPQEVRWHSGAYSMDT